MHDHTCCFCAHTFTGRRRKFCYDCLPAFGDVDRKTYMDRYNGLSAACGFIPAAWYSRWEPPGGWPRKTRPEPRPDHQCAGCDAMVPGTRKWCSDRCAARNRRHGVRRQSLSSAGNEQLRRSVAGRSKATAATKHPTRREQFLARCADMPVLPNPCVKCGGQLVEWWTLYSYRQSRRRCCYVCYLSECANRKERRTRQATPRKAISATCGNCGALFVKSKARRVACSEHCSKQLQRQAWRRKNIRRRTAAVGEPYTIQELRNRDGDNCHLCNKRINFNLPGSHPRGPHIDHLVPLADGGADCKTNVKMAHASCNIKRGTGGAVQLLLVG